MGGAGLLYIVLTGCPLLASFPGFTRALVLRPISTSARVKLALERG